MTTACVRKFVISLDDEEPLDYAQPLEYFDKILVESGLEKIGSYTYRYTDYECMIKVELSKTKDGFFIFVYVQAADEHEYRINELAEAFGGFVLVANSRFR